MEILLSNTTGRNRKAVYRLAGDVRRKLTVDIPRYAFNLKVKFPNEDAYKAFKISSDYLFTGKNPVLVEGKQIRKAKLENAKEGGDRELQKKVDDKADKDVQQQIGPASKLSKKGIKLEVVPPSKTE